MTIALGIADYRMIAPSIRSERVMIYLNSSTLRYIEISFDAPEIQSRNIPQTQPRQLVQLVAALSKRTTHGPAKLINFNLPRQGYPGRVDWIWLGESVDQAEILY